MALKNCKECKKEISDKAEKCPHCGAPTKRKPMGCGAAIAILILFPVIFISFESIFNPRKPLNSAPKISKTKEEIKDDVPNPNGGWRVFSSTNPVDDSVTVQLNLNADSGKGKWGDSISLTVVCKSNKTDLYINWYSFLGHETRVLSRVGDKKAETMAWSISTDKKVSFRPRPIAFLKKMMEADTLVTQTTPYNENPITAIFNTAGLENAIKPLREVCGW